MVANVEVKINPSFYRKVNAAAIKSSLSEAIRNTTLEAEKRCKIEAPGPGNQLPGTTYRASGNLRRSHSSSISSTQGQVRNSAKYAVYVIHGTSKMPARNYPVKIVNALSSEQYITRTLLTSLRAKGVIE